MIAPPRYEEAPAGRQGAISGKEIHSKYSCSMREAIRFARIALTPTELSEWMTNLLFDIKGVPSGAEDLKNLCREYLNQSEEQ